MSVIPTIAGIAQIAQAGYGMYTNSVITNLNADLLETHLADLRKVQLPGHARERVRLLSTLSKPMSLLCSLTQKQLGEPAELQDVGSKDKREAVIMILCVMIGEFDTYLPNPDRISCMEDFEHAWAVFRDIIAFLEHGYLAVVDSVKNIVNCILAKYKSALPRIGLQLACMDVIPAMPKDCLGKVMFIRLSGMPLFLSAANKATENADIRERLADLTQDEVVIVCAMGYNSKTEVLQVSMHNLEGKALTPVEDDPKPKWKKCLAGEKVPVWSIVKNQDGSVFIGSSTRWLRVGPDGSLVLDSNLKRRWLMDDAANSDTEMAEVGMGYKILAGCAGATTLGSFAAMGCATVGTVWETAAVLTCYGGLIVTPALAAGWGFCYWKNQRAIKQNVETLKRAMEGLPNRAPMKGRDVSDMQ